MYIFDNKVSIENREKLQEYLLGYRYCTSGVSFSSLYMWRNINQFSWDIIGDYMVMSGVNYLDLEEGILHPFLGTPLTNNGKYDPDSLRKTILIAKEKFEEKGYPFELKLIPFPLVEYFQKAFGRDIEITADRDNFDYLYKKEDLIELKGKLLHKKKNHMNYFLKNYEYEYKKLDSSMSEDAIDFIDRFNKKKDVPPHERELLKLEEKAMKDVFENIDEAKYLAGAVYIDGKMEALSVGGILNNNTVGTHIEKANIDYRGLYQIINMEFCKHMPQNIKYVNREEDMGLPGLRKSKLSYKPVKLVEKYNINFK
ncbi:MAG: phosphatidylglycerol lysyltransferase domain-containing protein [Eubacteriales bacterium]|nr:phosphatidylglycerol lysyltransferase domain-containing protein [Eubacteriales bacterium]MDY3332667.1 phosphatidylglycerol lysyltransferase domain-containing protein [Gallibacter sp.]